MNERILPIGTEFEMEFMPSAGTPDDRTAVWLYRVSAHRGTEGGFLREALDPISVRYRNTVNLYCDGCDAFGRQVFRRNLDGDPPSPTYQEMVEKIHGKMITV